MTPALTKRFSANNWLGQSLCFIAQNPGQRRYDAPLPCSAHNYRRCKTGIPVTVRLQCSPSIPRVSCWSSVPRRCTTMALYKYYRRRCSTLGPFSCAGISIPELVKGTPYPSSSGAAVGCALPGRQRDALRQDLSIHQPVQHLLST